MYRGFPAIRLGITIIVNSVMPRYPIKKAISTKRMKLMTGNIGSVPNVLKILAACLRKQLNSLTEPSMTGVQYPSESEKGSNWKAQPIRSLSVRMDELFSLEKLGFKGFPILSYLLNSMEKNAVLKNINITMKTFEV